jgi:Holliday junction resolvasome RuvABC endonuclease subunit
MNDNTIRHRILGVDPGTNIMGYAILDTELNKSNVEVLSVLQMTKLGDPTPN